MISLDIVLIMYSTLFIWIYDVHEQSCEDFDYYKLEDIFFATISKVLGFFPMRELIGFLAVSERPEVMYFLLVVNHDSVDLFVLD